MPISSFFGLQTSLRGLLAQQRALDTTATTSPTRPPRATRARRPSLAATQALERRRPAASASGGRARHRRRRPELPPRPRPASSTSSTARRTCSSATETARADALDQRELVALRAGRQRHQTRSTSSGAPGRTSRTAPRRGAAKQAVIDKSRTLPSRSTTCRATSPRRARPPRDEYTQTAGARRPDQPDRQRPLHDAERDPQFAAMSRRAQRPLRPPRPPARPAVDDGPGLDDAVASSCWSLPQLIHVSRVAPFMRAMPSVAVSVAALTFAMTASRPKARAVHVPSKRQSPCWLPPSAAIGPCAGRCMPISGWRYSYSSWTSPLSSSLTATCRSSGVGLLKGFRPSCSWSPPSSTAYGFAARLARSACSSLPVGPNSWGWFFVPIASFYKPYQAITMLWFARTGDGVFPPVFSAWWGLWFRVESRLVRIWTVIDGTWGMSPRWATPFFRAWPLR